MARIKKYADNLTQNLTYFQTYLVDTNPNSTYFRITEFKESFTGGKNGFLIEGSEHLKESTDIKIEILDVEGNPIYFEPGNGVPEYYEGLSKVVAVYIYEDTPIGNAKITVLGELKTYIDTDGVVQPIPDEWAGIYNLKWERDFNVNRLLSNEDKVRFYVRPQVSITEIVKPIFSNVVTTKTQTGSISGISQAPREGQSLTNYTSPTSYLLTTNDNTFWTASVVGTYLTFDDISYNPLVTNIINSREVIIQPPYTIDNGLVSNLTEVGYTASFNYIEGIDNLKTALTGSFAKITLSDLTTFVGDCARVKIFRKSTADLSDFQFVQEIQLESNEILVDLESTTKNQENYGLFDNTNFKSYWITSSNNLVTTFNQTFLYNSVKLNNTIGVEKFFTSKSFYINEGIEYSLNFNVKKESVGNTNNYIEAYLSGSKQTTINGLLTTVQVKQSIVKLETQNSLLQKQNITNNIKAEKIDNAKLYFDIKGSDWYVADISLKASQETAFSPDEITFVQPVPRSLPAETFVYRFEFYDINNNYIPVLVEKTKTFNGGNLQTIRKQLKLVPSSAGFQFDSGSNPVPPTVITIDEQKTLLTGSVHYTSQSFDFFGNSLSSSQYTQSIYQQPIPLYSGSGQYPGVLNGIGTGTVFMTVGNFTGSRSDINVQLVRLTGECEGFTDTINIYKILDGFGGVNHIIRPYRGTQIRNSSTASLEVQAVRIDGINDIILSKQSYKNFSDIQLHILKTASADYSTPEKFVNLSYVTSSNYIKGLITGSLGSKQIDYNAIFNRDSIDFRRIIYLMPSSSAASGPAYAVSSSVLASIILEDLQDGLDSGVVAYNADSFVINPRTETAFRPSFGFATASFSIRGTAGGNEYVTSSFQIYPSMSINKDWVPEYWMYYHTQSLHPTLTVVAKDDNKNIIPSQIVNGNVRSPLNQTKNLTLTFTYTEPWTSASVSLDKTFTIIPDGKPGDETIIFEVNPIAVTLGANSRGIVNDYRPSITDIKLKQGSRYLAFSSSAGVLDNLNTHGTFYIATASIIEKNVKAGNVQFTSSFGVPYTSSLIVSSSYNFTQLSGSIEYPLIIHPYYTSSIYTASVVVNYTKVLEGAPPIQILITPTAVTLAADEVGYVTPIGYSPANTTLQVKEGDDFLTFTTRSIAPGTWRINSIETRGGSFWNIQTGSLSSSSLSTATINYNRFDHPYVSASALYTIQVYPFALGAGHSYTSSIFTRTQTFTKNITPPKARSIDFKASSYTVNYDRNGVPSIASQSPIVLSATAFNTTASADKVYIVISEIAQDGSESGESAPIAGDSGTNPVTFTLPDVNYADVGPETIKTFKVKITDGNPYTSPTSNPYRAEAQLTISGVKAGADSYKLVASNENTTITADLWTTQFTGSGMKITTFNGVQQLINANPLPLPTNPSDFNYQGDPIGVLGYSSASIFSKSNWINTAITKPVFPSSNPAEIGNITTWTSPATNTSGQIVYRVDFEGDSSTTNTLIRPLARQTQFVTQSISVQFTPPAPYDVKMTNENSSVVYKVAGSLSFTGTGTIIRAYRGSTELVNTNPLPATDTDAYGTTGLSKDKCRITVQSYSSGIITLGGSLGASSFVTGTPATMPNIAGWVNPTANPTAEIVYKIECEGRQIFYKTQSLSIQYEGNVGPGLVMRGEWDATKDYYGSVENINDRLDVVTYQATSDDTKYYAAISGSGPNTYVNPTTSTFYRGASPGAGFNSIGAQAPTPATTQVPPVAYWRYLGTQDFFVAAKLAIFEKSYVKNSINVGTKDINGDFANIVINGGRTDPYIALGQVGSTAGTAGTAGTSITGTGIIGYDRPGIFLGIYENGTSGTTGRFSIKTTSTSGKGMSWDGDTLKIVGAIRQVEPGVSEGSLRGAWTTGFTYYTNDIVSYAGQSWQCTSAQAQSYQHVATNDTAVLTGYPGSGPWAIAAAAGTSGTAGSGGTAGTAGGPGPGVVYRGLWAQFEADGTTAKTYTKTSTRQDVVQGSDGLYYLAQSTHTTAAGGGGTSTRPIDGGSYSTYWAGFGATFSSIATGTIISEQSYVKNTLNVGTNTEGSEANIAIVGGTATPYISLGQPLQGYNRPGIFLGNSAGDYRMSMSGSGGFFKWNGSSLELSGNITATAGSIGNWTVLGGLLKSANSNIQLDGTNESMQVFDSGGSLRFSADTNTTLPSISGGGSSTVYLPAFTINKSTTDGGGDATPTLQTSLQEVSFTATTAGKHIFKSTLNPATAYTNNLQGYGSGYALLYLSMEVWSGAGGTGTQFGSSGTYYNYAYGSIDYSSGTGGGGGYISVTGDTLITLDGGSTIMAKDISRGDSILSWEWRNNFNKFISTFVTGTKTRKVDKIYKVNAGGYEVKVSDSHGFWLDNNTEIYVGDLVAGESEIYIESGGSIKKVLVDSIEIINEEVDVYTIEVAGTNNYISNNILSHNSYGSNGFYFNRQTAYLGTKNYTVQANLPTATTYYVVHRIDYLVNSDNTNVSPYNLSSDASIYYDMASKAVTVELVSAGTIANGGGFQAVSSDKRYIKLSTVSTDYENKGAASSLSGGVEAKGALYLSGNITDTTDIITKGYGKAFTDSSYWYGYPAAVKAFGTLNYTSSGGGNQGNVAYYTVTNSFNCNATPGLTGGGKYISIVFANDIGTSNYNVTLTPRFGTTGWGATVQIYSKSTSGFTYRIVDYGSGEATLGSNGNTGTYVDFHVMAL